MNDNIHPLKKWVVSIKYYFALIIALLESIPSISTPGGMYSVDTGDGFVITKFDDKLAGTLSIRKTGDFFRNYRNCINRWW